MRLLHILLSSQLTISTAACQQSPGTISAGSGGNVPYSVLVQVARHRTGEPITTLGANDFELWDNGTRVSLQSVDYRPLDMDVLLLVDGSHRMRETAQYLAQQLGPALKELSSATRVAIMTFADTTRLHLALTNERPIVISDLLRKALRENLRNEIAYIYEAIRAACDVLITGDPARVRAIVLLTDNHPAAVKRESLPSVVERLLTARVTVSAAVIQIPDDTRKRSSSRFPIRPGIPGVPPAIRASENPDLDQDAKQVGVITDSTGGDLFVRPQRAGDFLLLELLHRLRERYILRFKPPAADQRSAYHQLAVKLGFRARKMHPDAAIRAPKGYYHEEDDLKK